MRRVREVAPGIFQISVLNVAVTIVMDGDQAVVLDAGSRITATRVQAFLEAPGMHPEQVSHILVSHYHPDHIGGLHRLQVLTGALVGAPPSEAPAIRGDAPFPNPFTSSPLSPMLGELAKAVTPHPATVDLLLEDGVVVNVAGGISVIHTPGHTPGSVCFHLPERGMLFVGDALQDWFGNLDLPNALFTADMPAVRASIQRLAAVDFETLCFSHFRAFGADARSRLRQLADRVA
ncbi:MAG: MBL fold metallo-hydrolase [Dehalococcoidia bacterium]|nr:MBL fold metallo-hydrolase [Dehalococcoidia bacterium]